MDSAKLSIVHFNSEDVIATSGICLGSGHVYGFLGKITEIGADYIEAEMFYDSGDDFDHDEAIDGIYTYGNTVKYEEYEFERFGFVPQVGDLFHYDKESEPYYKCNKEHTLYYPDNQ